MSTNAPHRAIYRRWRAQTFAQIVGQEASVTSLRHAVRSGHLAHGLLFVGPRGTGKTSTARIVAKALNCLAPVDGEPDDTCEPCVEIREGRALDVVEMDAASNNKVEDMRDFLPRVWTAPSSLRRKVFIVDEVQRIREGWDVLLKTLEEPPDHVVFIFCTTDAGGVRPAVLSRLQRFDFTRLTEPQIAGKLRVVILAADGRQADDDAVALVARLADGGMRDAESMLDQLLSGGAERLTADRVRDLLGLADEESVQRFLAALVDGDPLPGIAVLDALDERGRDLRAFVDQCVDALRLAIVAALGPAPARGEVPLGDRPREALAAAARRLVDVDPARVGRGGLRFELELALLTAWQRASASVAAPTAAPSQAAAPATPAGGPTTSSRPPSAARPAAPPPAAHGPTVDLDLDGVVAAWPRIVALVGENPATKPLITACAPIAVDGANVTIAFPEAQSFLRERAEKRRSEIERGFDQVLGGRIVLRFVASNVVPVPPPADDRDGDRLLAEARRIFADDIVAVPEVD